MKRLATVAILLLAGCATLPGTGPGIGIIEDESLRAWLRPLALVEDQGCTLTVAGHPLAMRCRVFAGPADERIVAAYDLVSDRVKVVMALHSDGRQEVLWLPARRARGSVPEVRL